MATRVQKDGTVGKALEVLDVIAGIERPVRFSELLAQSPHPKATLYQLLQTLTNQGMLAYDPDRQTYSLGMRLVRMAHAAWRQSSLAPIARPHVDALASQLGETVHLAQMDQGQVVYVDKRNAANPLEMFSQAGKIGPGYCTGVGKAIMAHMSDEARALAISQQAFLRYTPTTLTSPEALEAELQEIRATGLSFDREEHENGIICIAAPIITDMGNVVGALSVTTSTTRNDLDGITAWAPAVRETAGQIGAEASAWQFPSNV